VLQIAAYHAVEFAFVGVQAAFASDVLIDNIRYNV
jgi:hypothetical protein